MTELPGTPGTVIAIGSWWLVLLPPFYADDRQYPQAWELLSPPTAEALISMRAAGVKWQHVYSDDWVRAEVEQHGGYDIVAVPVTELDIMATRKVALTREEMWAPYGGDPMGPGDPKEEPFD